MTNSQQKPSELLPASAQAVQQRNRKQMIAIMLIAFTTLGGSYGMYYFAQTTGGWGTTNNGAFVDPPVTTQQLGWQVQGDRDRWWLWTVARDCNRACQDNVQNMRALHILLNREADRVRRGYTGLADPQSLAWLAEFPKLAKIGVTDAAAMAEGIYIVDPNGNLVFSYPLDTNPKPVLQDLKKLLKLSQIG